MGIIAWLRQVLSTAEASNDPPPEIDEESHSSEPSDDGDSDEESRSSEPPGDSDPFDWEAADQAARERSNKQANSNTTRTGNASSGPRETVNSKKRDLERQFDGR